MHIPIISKFYRRARLRRVMRGYRILKQVGELGKISEVKTVLTNTVISSCKGRVNSIFFGAAVQSAELAIRQYLLIRIGGLGLNKAILASIGKANAKIIYPLPAEWRMILKDNGFNIAIVRSSLMWYGYCLLLYLYGIISFLRATIKDLAYIFEGKAIEVKGKYVYFDTLTKGNLPQSTAGGISYDIVSWYYKNIGKKQQIEMICHSVQGIQQQKLNAAIPVIYIPSPIPLLGNLKKSGRYVVWGGMSVILAIVDLFRGRWWHAVMLHESILAARTRLQTPEKLAHDYMFHNSNWIYRPLWTYEAEKLGSRILFYFYSTNVEPFLKADGLKNITTYGWQASNWPNILVWDKGQESFIRNDVGDKCAHISIVGTIWFSASEEKLDSLPTETIAVFDVQPVRDSYYQILGLSFEYYVPSVVNRFLFDIYAVLSSHNINMALKRKRKIGNSAHPKYRKIVDTLEQKSNFIAIDPEVAASYVIEECIAVISMPFTSTALLAREQGKPSVYYDPQSLCQKDDPAAHGITIISGKEELEKWVCRLDKAKEI